MFLCKQHTAGQKRMTTTNNMKIFLGISFNCMNS